MSLTPPPSTDTLRGARAASCHERRRGASTAARRPHDENRDGDRGAVAAQALFAILVLAFTAVAIVQVALAAYANHIAQGAADQALDEARILGGTTTDGQTEAEHVLTQLATGPLEDAHVRVTRTATTVTVTITGHAERIWLGPALPVHASASGPIEQFTTEP